MITDREKVRLGQRKRKVSRKNAYSVSKPLVDPRLVQVFKNWQTTLAYYILQHEPKSLGRVKEQIAKLDAELAAGVRLSDSERASLQEKRESLLIQRGVYASHFVDKYALRLATLIKTWNAQAVLDRFIHTAPLDTAVWRLFEFQSHAPKHLNARAPTETQTDNTTDTRSSVKKSIDKALSTVATDMESQYWVVKNADQLERDAISEPTSAEPTTAVPTTARPITPTETPPSQPPDVVFANEMFQLLARAAKTNCRYYRTLATAKELMHGYILPLQKAVDEMQAQMNDARVMLSLYGQALLDHGNDAAARADRWDEMYCDLRATHDAWLATFISIFDHVTSIAPIGDELIQAMRDHGLSDRFTATIVAAGWAGGKAQKFIDQRRMEGLTQAEKKLREAFPSLFHLDYQQPLADPAVLNDTGSESTQSTLPPERIPAPTNVPEYDRLKRTVD